MRWTSRIRRGICAVIVGMACGEMAIPESARASFSSKLAWLARVSFLMSGTISHCRLANSCFRAMISLQTRRWHYSSLRFGSQGTGDFLRRCGLAPRTGKLRHRGIYSLDLWSAYSALRNQLCQRELRQVGSELNICRWSEFRARVPPTILCCQGSGDKLASTAFQSHLRQSTE